LAIIPRVSGVSGRSTNCCMRRKPSPRIVCRIVRGQPMKLRTQRIFKVPDFFFVTIALKGWLRRRRFLGGNLAPGFRHLRGVLQMQQGVESGLDHIVRIRRS